MKSSTKVKQVGPEPPFVDAQRRYTKLNKKYQQDDYSWLEISDDADKEELAYVWKILAEAAERGHAMPQAVLGSAYDFSQGVEKDVVEAAKWNRLAANQGVAAAQFSLGNAYANGSGVERSYSKALKWWKLAAKQGHEDARLNIQDNEEAMKPAIELELQEERERKEQSPIAMESRVTLFGLISKSELNGAQGIVKNFTPSSGRCVVKLDDKKLGNIVNVKPQNIQVAVEGRGAESTPNT